MTTPEILGYVADVRWTDGTTDMLYLTVQERMDQIGDGRVAAATYVPLVAGLYSTHAVAFLVRVAGVAFRVVRDWSAARLWLEQSGDVTSLIVGTQPVERY